MKKRLNERKSTDFSKEERDSFREAMKNLQKALQTGEAALDFEGLSTIIEDAKADLESKAESLGLSPRREEETYISYCQRIARAIGMTPSETLAGEYTFADLRMLCLQQNKIDGMLSVENENMFLEKHETGLKIYSLSENLINALNIRNILYAKLLWKCFQTI